MTTNFGDRYLRVYNVDVEAWCRRYDLRPFVAACGRCGRAVAVAVPFIAAGRRGLCAEACPCGHEHLPFTFVDLGYPSTGPRGAVTIHHEDG